MEEQRSDLPSPRLITVPVGPFTMGTSDVLVDRLVAASDEARVWHEKGRFDRERPDHTVVLSEYAIAKHPVTVGEYRNFVEAGGYATRRFWTESGWAWMQGQRRTLPSLGRRWR